MQIWPTCVRSIINTTSTSGFCLSANLQTDHQIILNVLVNNISLMATFWVNLG